MKRALQKLAAAVLTLPVFIGLTRIDALVAWIQGDTAWKALTPLFRLFGVIGSEGEEDVIIGVLLVISFLIALCVVLIIMASVKRWKARELQPPQ
ncbi:MULTISPECIES: hypothetical protein [Paraburkholderia]|uniref:hypothetical protein n=1 Tax=Paraburkholderia TaxID=1822464 RepID=UPI00225A3E32|nr:MULTISPECIES: hypothetical protein [Paraburkholderia]MCX4156162.1 hypothetical protein [Paraburkholderia aspalathi]MDN7165568.1 hypothetical protein [Paraburkholderia sp. SECH2]MDQ6394054.1 hypothetical protein [Paraburkholderia aspalathi]